MASSDPLYEFSHTSFESQFSALLQRALLPLLEYTSELYGLPPDVYDVYNIKLPSGARHVKHQISEYYFKSDPILQPILEANRDKSDGQQSFRAGQLWKSITTFSLPKDENHEFWRRSSLDPTDGNYPNSVLVQVSAFGASPEEVKSFAIMKFINLVKLIRMILWNRDTNDMQSLISKYVRKSTRPVFPELTSSALNMGLRLFAFYQEHDIKDDKFWHSMTTLIKELLQKYSADLKPLLEFYLVHPFFAFSITNEHRRIRLSDKSNL